jgi:hypothetical protein
MSLGLDDYRMTSSSVLLSLYRLGMCMYSLSCIMHHVRYQDQHVHCHCPILYCDLTSFELFWSIRSVPLNTLGTVGHALDIMTGQY